MSYRPDYLDACGRVARALSLSGEETGLLAVAGPSAFTGQVSAQVPEADVGAALRMGWIKDRSDHDAGHVGRLVEEGYLAWRTSRGWSHDPEGRHPTTGRSQPSRQLWLTDRTVEEIGPALYRLFLEGLESVRAKAESGPALLREGYLARLREGLALDEVGFLERLTATAAPVPEAVGAPSP